MRSPTFDEVVGFTAFALNVWGNVELIRKSSRGYVIRIVAIVVWGLYGLRVWSLPVVANAMTFFCINCVGWWKWRHEQQREST